MKKSLAKEMETVAVEELALSQETEPTKEPCKDAEPAKDFVDVIYYFVVFLSFFFTFLFIYIAFLSFLSVVYVLCF